MENLEALHVWYEKTLVGQISCEQANIISFSYTDDWLNHGFAISQQLPLSIKDYSITNPIAHYFFTNLLPEGGTREKVIKTYKIPNTDFHLLKAIGGECAGALSILPLGMEPNIDPNYKKLTQAELYQLVSHHGDLSYLSPINDLPRLSLAGAQDKVPILYHNGEFSLTQDTAPSSHILKFEILAYKNIPAYEYFLSQLAQAISLPVAESQLHKIKRHYYLVIKRYDRHIDGKHNIIRLHQEDFCQALGFSYNQKYQQDGGPSFSDCFKLLQNISYQPIIDCEYLLQWQLFNVLAGNSDGHAKNLALLYNQHQEITLAPFYDLVCTRAIQNLDPRLAMAVGNQYHPDKLTTKNWLSLAQECHIRPSYLKKLMIEMADQILDKLAIVTEKFENEVGPYPALQRVKSVITKQCRKMAKLAI